MFSRKQWRLNLLFGFLFAALVVILARLFQIQGLQYGKYRALAETQHGISYNIPAPRGKVYSRDGFPLVSNQSAYLLYAKPSVIKSSELSSGEIARRVLDVLYVDSCPVVNFVSSSQLDDYQRRQACEQHLSERLGYSRQWVPLVTNLTGDQKERIEALEVSGLGFEITPVRYYPEGTLAANVLGLVGSDEKGEPQGYYGLEGFYDGDLRGQEGAVIEERGALGEPILTGDYTKRPPKEGRDLKLTIDRAVQFMVEEKLEDGVKKFGAESGTVVVLDPKTGAVIAMTDRLSTDAEQPLEMDFDLEGFQEEDLDGGNNGDDEKDQDEEEDKDISVSPSMYAPDDVHQRNLAISSSYEPGSVIKSLTMAAAIDEGKITPQTTFISRPLEIGSHTIRTWDDQYYGRSTMIEVLERSDNTGAAWVVMEKLGKRSLHSYFVDFGLGQKTGIDLEGESAGILNPLSEWRPVDVASASFGHGLSATPLQVASAFTVFANEGVLMQPYVVSEIRGGNREIKFSPQRVRRVVSKHAAKVMQGMLTRAAAHGEASFFVLEDWEVAGKTGTAQIPVGGGYHPHLTNATFVGFLPQSENFVMLVKLGKPSTSIYAAETAVPLWMDIAKELIRYYAIPPDR